MDVLVGPVHFGDVNQTLDTLFELGEAAVVGEVGDTGVHLGAFRVTILDVDPRIFAQLLQTQGDAVALAVELQHLDGDLVADSHDLARMLDALPGHVGDVEQAVDAAQINEGTVVGQVLDDTDDLLAFLQGGEQRFTLGAVLGFENGTTGNDNVVALRIELDDLEVELFVFQVRGVAHRTNVDQRAGQEGTDGVDVDSEAALDLAVDHALDDLFLLEGSFQHLPRFGTLGLLAGQAGFAEAVFHGFEGHVDLVTDGNGQFAAVVAELRGRDLTFGLQAGIDGDPVTFDVDDSSRDDRARLHVDVLERLFKQFSKAFAHDVPT